VFVVLLSVAVILLSSKVKFIDKHSLSYVKSVPNYLNISCRHYICNNRPNIPHTQYIGIISVSVRTAVNVVH